MIYKGGIEHPLPFPTLIARTNSNQSCITISSRKEEEEKKKKKEKLCPINFTTVAWLTGVPYHHARTLTYQKLLLDTYLKHREHGEIS